MRSVKNFLLIGLLVSLAVCICGCGGGDKPKVESAEEAMVKNKAVRIITSAVNAPFEFGAGTGVQGYSAEIAEAIAKELNYPITWSKSKGYDHLFDVLKEGGGEMMVSSAVADPQKEQFFDFSKPYYETGDVIAHQRSAPIKDLASLAGKKVGVEEGRPGDIFMSTQKTAANVTIKKYPTMDDALGALNRTEVDAVVGDEILIAYSSVNSFQNTNVQPTLINKYAYAVAVRKGETALLQKINAVIDRMKSSGDLAKLEEKYTFSDIRTKAQQRTAGDEKEETLKKSAKTISVTINKLSGSWPMDTLDGFEFVLEGPGGRYVSTPILTEGNRGTCRFTRPVPPGDYKLNISILGLKTTVPVPEVSKSSLSMTMNIAGTTTIQFK